MKYKLIENRSTFFVNKTSIVIRSSFTSFVQYIKWVKWESAPENRLSLRKPVSFLVVRPSFFVQKTDIRTPNAFTHTGIVTEHLVPFIVEEARIVPRSSSIVLRSKNRHPNTECLYPYGSRYRTPFTDWQPEKEGRQE